MTKHSEWRSGTGIICFVCELVQFTGSKKTKGETCETGEETSLDEK